MPLFSHIPSISLVSLRTGKVFAAKPIVKCTHTGLDDVGPDLGAATPLPTQGQGGSTPWGSSYKVARSTRYNCESVFDMFECALPELATGSNTPPTDTTNLLVRMQHKSGTALLSCDSSHPLDFRKQKLCPWIVTLSNEPCEVDTPSINEHVLCALLSKLCTNDHGDPVQAHAASQTYVAAGQLCSSCMCLSPVNIQNP